ncbi:MAG: aminotransferase class I/II-fold pyridoxal phosphate-dependent enzyme, partial [Flavobacteriales bacterium]
EGVTVPINTTLESNFKMTAEQLEAAITPKSKLLIYSSPCTPTGSVFTRDELASFAEVLRKHPHLYVLSDEIYEHINFLEKHESIAQFEDIRDRIIVVNGVSKGYAMTGWRIGYIGASKEIAAACDKMQGQFTSAASSIAQKAAEAALSMDITPTLEMQKAFHRRRDLVIGLMKDIPGVRLNDPQGAFYIFADIRSYLGSSNGQQK